MDTLSQSGGTKKKNSGSKNSGEVKASKITLLPKMQTFSSISTILKRKGGRAEDDGNSIGARNRIDFGLEEDEEEDDFEDDDSGTSF